MKDTVMVVLSMRKQINQLTQFKIEESFRPQQIIRPTPTEVCILVDTYFIDRLQYLEFGLDLKENHHIDTALTSITGPLLY